MCCPVLDCAGAVVMGQALPSSKGSLFKDCLCEVKQEKRSNSKGNVDGVRKIKLEMLKLTIVSGGSMGGIH